MLSRLFANIWSSLDNIICRLFHYDIKKSIADEHNTLIRLGMPSLVGIALQYLSRIPRANVY